MIYVDQLKPCTPTRQWPHEQYCRLFSDSIADLHRFAVGRMGLKMAWFQTHTKLPHYALTIGNRFKALKLGAIELDDEKAEKFAKAPYQYAGQV